MYGSRGCLSPSDIEHPMEGRGVYAARAIGKADDGGGYYNALIYGQCDRTPSINGCLSDGHFRVFADESLWFSVRLIKKSTDTCRDWRRLEVYLFSASSRIMRFNNYPRDIRLPKRQIRESEKEKIQNFAESRRANAIFDGQKAANSRLETMAWGMVTVKPLRDFQRRKELYLDYGDEYCVWDRS